MIGKIVINYWLNNIGKCSCSFDNSNSRRSERFRHETLPAKILGSSNLIEYSTMLLTRWSNVFIFLICTCKCATNRYKFFLSKGFPIHLVNDIHKPTRQSMQFADQMKLKAPLKPIDPCYTSKIHIEVWSSLLSKTADNRLYKQHKTTGKRWISFRISGKMSKQYRHNTYSKVFNIREYGRVEKMREQRRHVFVGISVQVYL